MNPRALVARARSLPSKPLAATVFLRLFVKELMLHTAAYSERVARLRKAQMLHEQRLPPVNHQTVAPVTMPVSARPQIPILRPVRYAPAPHQAPRAPQPSVQPLPLFSLPSFAALVRDAQIAMIECQGPDKPLIITQQGRPEVSKVILSTEDIATIIQEVSQYTHIPIVQGLFKALIGPFSISGVNSEVAGSRFILQRSTHG